jgi:hypothetical protein
MFHFRLDRGISGQVETSHVIQAVLLEANRGCRLVIGKAEHLRKGSNPLNFCKTSLRALHSRMGRVPPRGEWRFIK